MPLSEEQRMVQEMAARFARERLAPNSREWEQAGAVPGDVLGEMGDMGFMGMTVDEQWGGAGLDYVSYALALIEIAAGDASVSTIMSVNNAPVCAILTQAANDAQREQFLKPLAKGEMIGAFALSEPQAGSDASNLRTKAERRGKAYLLNGTKQFITSGRIAGVTVVFAVTDPEARSRGISAFLAPAGIEGFNVSKTENKLGQIASDTCQLSFSDMSLDESLRVGKEGDGYRIALSNLETGRIGIAAQSVGIAQAALDIALSYCSERTSFGKPLWDHQGMSFRLAEMGTRLEAARAPDPGGGSVEGCWRTIAGESLYGQNVCQRSGGNSSALRQFNAWVAMAICGIIASSNSNGMCGFARFMKVHPTCRK